MKKKSILLPHTCQKIGWWLLLMIPLGVWFSDILYDFFSETQLFAMVEGNIRFFIMVCYLLLIASTCMICLSKEKVEDEMVSQYRHFGLCPFHPVLGSQAGLRLAGRFPVWGRRTLGDRLICDYGTLHRPDPLHDRCPVLPRFQMVALAFQEGGDPMKNTVRVERAILDITQQQLADAIGVSRNTINSIESGKYVPSTVLALKIARHFGKSTDSIFQLEDTD